MRPFSNAAKSMLGYIEQFGKDLAKEVDRDEILNLLAQLEGWEKNRVLQALRKSDDAAEDTMVYGRLLELVHRDKKAASIALELRKLATALDTS